MNRVARVLLLVGLWVTAVPIPLGQSEVTRWMMGAVRPVFTEYKLASFALQQVGEPTPEPTSDQQDGTLTDKIGPAFEVASIRPSNVGSSFGWKLTPSGRFTAEGQPLINLVVLAYGGPDGGSIDGGLKWTDFGPFDINAKVDDAYMAGWDKLTDTERFERVRPMIRELMAERFHLKLHSEMRVTPVYALVQTKGGAKLTEVAPPGPEDPEEQQKRQKGDPTAKAPPGGMWLTANTWMGNATPIKNLLGTIAALGANDRILIDETGSKATTILPSISRARRMGRLFLIR